MLPFEFLSNMAWKCLTTPTYCYHLEMTCVVRGGRLTQLAHSSPLLVLFWRDLLLLIIFKVNYCPTHYEPEWPGITESIRMEWKFLYGRPSNWERSHETPSLSFVWCSLCHNRSGVGAVMGSSWRMSRLRRYLWGTGSCEPGTLAVRPWTRWRKE